MKSSVVDQVLDKLIQAGLVHLTEASQSEDDQIEITHESLIHSWSYYQQWLKEEELTRYKRWRLAKDAQDWALYGRPAHLLLQKWRLEEIRIYQNLSPLENEFIQASKLMNDALDQEEEKYKIQAKFMEGEIKSGRLREENQKIRLKVLELELQEIKLREVNQSSRLRELEKVEAELLVQKKKNRYNRILAILCLIVSLVAIGVAMSENHKIRQIDKQQTN